MGNYKDSKMQSLSQKGNGNYAYIDTYQEAQKFLEREFKGSLYAIAKDVKIQIEFNPKHVDSYRLIGYETRMLEDRDFADDTKDAGEIGVNHQVTALYEVIPRGVESRYGEFTPDLKYQKVEQPNLQGFSDELATVKFRYKPPTSDKSIKLERIIKNESVKLKKTSADFKFATAVAWFGLKLRDSQLISKTDKTDIIELAKEGLSNDKDGYRAEFIRLVRLCN
jgi:Ca-activated chloride channel family protein